MPRTLQPCPIRDKVAFTTNTVPVLIVHAQGRRQSPVRLAYHPEIEFQLIKRGTGAYFIDGRNYSFSKDSLLIIKPKQVHSFIPDPDVVFEKVTFMLAWSPRITIPARLRYIWKLPNYLRLTKTESAMLDTLLRQMKQELDRRDSFWQNIVRTKTAEWMHRVRRISQRPMPPPAEHPILKQLLAYLESQYPQSSSNPQIAAAFGYSENYLTQLCKRYTGLGLKQYLLQRRIVEAQKLLLNESQLKVAAIAARVGFNHFVLFNRSFKKMVGATPSEYRRIYYLPAGKW